EARAVRSVGRLGAKTIAKRSTIHHSDVPPRRRRGDTARRGGGCTHAGERRKESVKGARLFGDQDHSPDGVCRVGMLLELRIPEIFRKVLLASSKADRRRFGIARKRKRKADFDRRAIRPFALALEAHGLGDANPGGAKACGIGRGIIAFEDQQGKSLPVFEKDSVERAEQRREAIAS